MSAVGPTRGATTWRAVGRVLFGRTFVEGQLVPGTDRQGESVLAIGRLLGHRSAETTLKYTHPADAMARDAAEIVGAILEG